MHIRIFCMEVVYCVVCVWICDVCSCAYLIQHKRVYERLFVSVSLNVYVNMCMCECMCVEVWAHERLCTYVSACAVMRVYACKCINTRMSALFIGMCKHNTISVCKYLFNVHAWQSMCMCIYVCLHVSLYVWECMSACAEKRARALLHVWIYVFVYAYVCVEVYGHEYISIYLCYVTFYAWCIHAFVCTFIWAF